MLGTKCGDHHGVAMRTLRPRQWSIAWLLLLPSLPSCTSTHIVAIPSPAQLVQTARPPSIRGTLANGVTFVLGAPLIQGDSLVGTVGSPDATRTISLALKDLSNVAIAKPSAISWQVGTPTPAQFVEAERPKSIHVKRTDGTTLTIKSPVIRQDSLVSAVLSDGAAPFTGVPLTDVGTVTITKVDGVKSVLLILGPLAAGFILIVSSMQGSS